MRTINTKTRVAQSTNKKENSGLARKKREGERQLGRKKNIKNKQTNTNK